MTAMRVLYVTNMYPSERMPSAGIFVEQQIAGLRRAGVDAEVLFIDRLHEGRSAYSGLPGRLRETLAAKRADLVHVMYGGVMAERATRACGDLPVVITFHGSDLQGSVGAGPVDRLSAAYGVWSSRKAALRASGIVVVAPHLALRLPEVPADRVRVIPCGIDLERFRPQDRTACRRTLGWGDDGFHVLFATGNGDPVKRPELARDAVRRLTARGVPAELHVMRGVRNEDVPVWLNAADALLLTSYHEGSPTIVKEAMACDRPIVSVPVGDVVAQLDGIAGSHVVDADPEALAGGLLRVHGGGRTADSRSRVAAQSLEATSRRLLDFYEWILTSRSGRDTRERAANAIAPVAESSSLRSSSSFSKGAA
jgi:glycosyltransferase involved in cell wall biosynthesis